MHAKFEIRIAFPVNEIIGGTRKKLGSPCIRPRSLFPKFFMGLYSDGPLNVLAKFEICSFPRS